MADDPTQAPAAVEAVDDQPLAQSEAGASGDEQSSAPNSSMDGFIRGLVARPTSNPADADEDEVSASPSEDVKPSAPARGADGKFLGRRGSAARIEELERLVAERDPSKIREQVIADQQREAANAAAAEYDKDLLGDEDTFQASIAMADSDPRLNDPSPTGKETLYQWREDRKERRAQYPTVERHYMTVADQRVVAEREAFLSDQRTQLQRHASKPGVDVAAFKKLTSYDEHGDYLYEAGARNERAKIAARMQELERDNQQLRLTGPRGIGSTRAPLAAGRSSAGAPPNNMDDWIRGKLR